MGYSQFFPFCHPTVACFSFFFPLLSELFSGNTDTTITEPYRKIALQQHRIELKWSNFQPYHRFFFAALLFTFSSSAFNSSSLLFSLPLYLHFLSLFLSFLSLFPPLSRSFTNSLSFFIPLTRRCLFQSKSKRNSMLLNCQQIVSEIRASFGKWHSHFHIENGFLQKIVFCSPILQFHYCSGFSLVSFHNNFYPISKFSLVFLPITSLLTSHHCHRKSWQKQWKIHASSDSEFHWILCLLQRFGIICFVFYRNWEFKHKIAQID